MTDPLFLLGKRPAGPFARLRHKLLDRTEAVQQAYAQHGRARWVVPHARSLALLTGAVHAHDRWHRVLLLEPASTARREVLHALFRVVVAPDAGVALLPQAELAEVMASNHAEDLFIGGAVDREDRALVLYRGNLDRVVIPFSWFRARRGGPRPDFDAFGVTDFGQTVQLGSYEAAADAILYEFDAATRRRMRARELERDSSLGGAVRRLRLQRGLSRSDFAPLDQKTIARIERGEVQAPHADTLGLIAHRLGVEPASLGSY